MAGVVQNFAFVYELCVKMIRRRLELDAAFSEEVAVSNVRNFIRTAAEKGLITDAKAWFRYRLLRNMTSHTYDSAKALMVCQHAGKLLAEARAVLKALDIRNEQAND